jgi:hypothetical protein
MYPSGTIINASDRKYIVDNYGCWRVYEYKENSSTWKKLARTKKRLSE